MSHKEKTSPEQCGACRHFRNDAGYLETALAGLTCLSSAYGSVRYDDGICLRHDRLIAARASCADFAKADIAARTAGDRRVAAPSFDRRDRGLRPS